MLRTSGKNGGKNSGRVNAPNTRAASVAHRDTRVARRAAAMRRHWHREVTLTDPTSRGRIIDAFVGRAGLPSGQRTVAVHGMGVFNLRRCRSRRGSTIVQPEQAPKAGLTGFAFAALRRDWFRSAGDACPNKHPGALKNVTLTQQGAPIGPTPLPIGNPCRPGSHRVSRAPGALRKRRQAAAASRSRSAGTHAAGRCSSRALRSRGIRRRPCKAECFFSFTTAALITYRSCLRRSGRRWTVRAKRSRWKAAGGPELDGARDPPEAAE